MKNKKVTARRFATGLAAVGMLVASSGVALMVTAPSAGADPISQPNSNHEDHWETLPGEVCVKTDTGAESGNVILPAEPDGRDYSKLIIKKGSGNIGPENQVFNAPLVVGAPGYEWVGDNPQQSGGWSHYIVCTVPEPEVEPIETTANVTPVQPTCDNANVASYTTSGENVTFDESAAPAPGASITVTATADAGYVFDGGVTTLDFPLSFNEAETPCDEVPPVEPPVDNPPVNNPPVAGPPAGGGATPTVVSAGLGEDLRGEQGLALLVAGMVMTFIAGGVGVRARG